ncbi:MAG TPA: BON domain-containing protein [Longimicrobiaceae bacterium]|nr:BON domain-containing protein [Longimicrobiaceae bacterium]
MKNQANLLLGMAIGAGIMYLLDPDRGKRRRSLVRDQITHAGNEMGGVKADLNRAGRDLRNRTRGAVAEAKGRMRSEHVDDDVLEARVRAEIGHAVSDAGSVEVHADHGRVTLAGSLPADEVAGLVAATERVRGVREVNNRVNTGVEQGTRPDQG